MPYALTAEGKKYLARGLPEKRLLDLLASGQKRFEDVRAALDDFSIAIQWAKKRGWVAIEKDVIRAVGKPGHIPEQEALGRIAQGRDVDEKLVELLIQRRLVEKTRDLLPEEGQEVTHLTEALIKTGAWKRVSFRPYNVEAVGKTMHIGKRQPYNRFLLGVRRKLVEMGFIEMTGPTVELEFWNFDALYQAQNHPSRDWTETYSMKKPAEGALPDRKLVARVKATHENGWETGSTGWRYQWDEKKALRLMPRAHDTAISPRTLLLKPEIPGKYFQIVRCYRPDVIDATHGVEFNQMGGFVVAEHLNFRDLLGLLKQFAFEIAGAEDVKFYADYYPFTEPSVQVSVKHPQLGWIELAGAGIFREELTKPLGIDAPVIAWGFGIDRLAMFKLGIEDIRYLFSRNLEWLRNAVVA